MRGVTLEMIGVTLVILHRFLYLSQCLFCVLLLYNKFIFDNINIIWYYNCVGYLCFWKECLYGKVCRFG